eukprot:COSAG01_NODE_61926_length_287_cov_0.808511_1_plen_34_part_10
MPACVDPRVARGAAQARPMVWVLRHVRLVRGGEL